jgi:hypothetical protein
MALDPALSKNLFIEAARSRASTNKAFLEVAKNNNISKNVFLEAACFGNDF